MTRLGKSLELNFALLRIYIESSMREGCLVVCGAYLHAECCDLQYALDSEHPREAHVHVLQRVLVLFALLMELQCIHWQTHGRTDRHTYVRTSLNRVSRVNETFFSFFWHDLLLSFDHRRWGRKKRLCFHLFFFFSRNSVHRYMNILCCTIYTVKRDNRTSRIKHCLENIIKYTVQFRIAICTIKYIK